MGIIRNALRRKPDKILPGFKSGAQWAKEEGLSCSHCRKYLLALVESGQWQVRKFLVLRGDVVRPVPYYAPKKTKS